jgi:hypothetical protein
MDNPSKRLLQTIVYDRRLFTEDEARQFIQRLPSDPDRVLLEAKRLEQQRWINYKQNHEFIQHYSRA